MIQNFPTNAGYPTFVRPQPCFYAMPHEVQAQPMITPTDNDVLMGRGGNNNKWRGNERLRDLARVQVDRYQQADKKEKSNISLLLVSQVQALSGRFLKRNSDSMIWQIVPDEQAREKTSQCLRDAVSGAKKRSRKSAEAKKEKESPTPVSVASSAPTKRKMIPCELEVDMSELFSNKRRRVAETTEDDGTVCTFITAPDAVVAYLLENAPANKFFEEINFLADLDGEPFDFELFDSNTLLDGQKDLWEPIDIGSCTIQ